MRIGEIAARAGVPAKTIRFWEHPGASAVHRRVIADEREAARAGMHGSPTLLVNGADPFAAPGQHSGGGAVACRRTAPGCGVAGQSHGTISAPHSL
jgi:MerR HTH family regulatory protein